MAFRDGELALNDVHYERRMVFFFDILGWQAHILDAKEDPQRIAALASVLRIFSPEVMSGVERAEGAYMSTFSDCVVVSLPYRSDQLVSCLEGLAEVLVGAACLGFLFRGASTIGNLFHDANIVFGPALNRAYELESKSAVYPLVLLDPDILEYKDLKSDCLYTEDNNTFLDPFNHVFIDGRFQCRPNTQAQSEVWAKKIGCDTSIGSASITSSSMLNSILCYLRSAIEKNSADAVKAKYEWLFERIKGRIAPS